MKTRKILIFISVAFSFMLYGCPYEAQFPLSNPGESSIDSNYVGFWESVDKDSKEQLSGISITAFNDHEYFIEMIMKASSGLMLQNFRAFSTTINNQHFLSIQDIGNKPKYSFYKYSLVNDTLKTIAVSDNFLKEKFKNKEELASYILKNLNEPKLYADEHIFVKKKTK